MNRFKCYYKAQQMCLLVLLCPFVAFGNQLMLDSRAINSSDSYLVSSLYYGLKEYSWPINYLNAIREEDIDSDIAVLKTLGFNTVILLASWSEFEPSIGISSEKAYKKINLIIEGAKKNDLKVLIRIPYLWSLPTDAGGDDGRQRIAYALVAYKGYRTALLGFLKHFKKEVIQKNTNVTAIFGSWEDFYILRDFFFSNEPSVSSRVRGRFSSDTRIRSKKVVQNGIYYDLFNDWMDTRIAGLAKDIQRTIGAYGYEIRTDADPYINTATDKLD